MIKVVHPLTIQKSYSVGDQIFNFPVTFIQTPPPPGGRVDVKRLRVNLKLVAGG